MILLDSKQIKLMQIRGEIVWETVARPFEKSLISKRYTASVRRTKKKARDVLGCTMSEISRSATK